TGMSTLDEVAAAVDLLEAAGTSRTDIILLHCTTQYPTLPADVNLRAFSSALMDCTISCIRRIRGLPDCSANASVVCSK
ncbi:MAG: N-acetylneuraminate synthase, partial [Firmicutes bacterium]|nr:N-acetylneuraminate synthase [Bacillota bacterium]